MTRKSLRTCVLLLGLLLVTSSSADADTISITTVSVSNIQIVPTSGTIVFSAPQFGSPTSASGAAVSNFEDDRGNSQQHPTHSQASISLTFASAGGVSDLPTLSLSSFGNVTLPGCRCDAETEGLASIRLGIMVVGGTGSVDVNFSALLQTMQTLMIDEFSSFAASQARMSLRVFHPDCADVFNPNCGNVNHSFSFASNVVIRPPDASTALEIERQISETVTLQFGQQYTVQFFVGSNSRAGEAIPEPATVVLLVSGLGFMAGFARKRRAKGWKK